MDECEVFPGGDQEGEHAIGKASTLGLGEPSAHPRVAGPFPLHFPCPRDSEVWIRPLVPREPPKYHVLQTWYRLVRRGKANVHFLSFAGSHRSAFRGVGWVLRARSKTDALYGVFGSSTGKDYTHCHT